MVGARGCNRVGATRRVLRHGVGLARDGQAAAAAQAGGVGFDGVGDAAAVGAAVG